METPAAISKDTSTEEVVTRHDFLTLAWKGLLGLSGLLGLGGLWRFLSYPPDPAPVTRYNLGPAERFPVGVEFKVNEAGAIVKHTPAGFRAFSLTCPHLGCVVDPSPQGFLCPCHGSRFTADGAYIQGPARQALRELKVEITAEGDLLIDTASQLF